MKYLFVLLSLVLTACGAKNLSKDADTVEKSEVITLTRQWQRVIRYDCQNQVTSDQVETVKSPTYMVEIKPNTMEKIWSSNFRNLTNSWGSGAVTGYTKFTIDMAPTLLNMKVEKGINQIKYQFYYCQNVKEWVDQNGNKQKECVSGADLNEEGSLFLNIFYEETTLPGFIESRPSPESCKPPQN